MTGDALSRRTFLALAGAVPLASALGHAAEPPARKKIPVGLEMYTLKDEEQKDRFAALRAVAKMGYEGVEFWGPYFEWTPAYAKEIKTLLDDLGIVCFSTHTRPAYWTDEHFPHVIELNKILASRYVVMDHAPESPTLEGWKRNAAMLTKGYETLKPLGIGAALHNWTTEWRMCEGQRPIDFLAANTPPGFAFQIDLGTALGERGDPVAFVKANPGRIKSYHLKDYSADRSKRGLLIGEGDAPWKEIFDAAETVGGVEYYLVEQEGSRFTPLETAERSLKIFRELHG
jgi:sugar phosphate isomerase/epimerase